MRDDVHSLKSSAVPVVTLRVFFSSSKSFARPLMKTIVVEHATDVGAGWKAEAVHTHNCVLTIIRL